MNSIDENIRKHQNLILTIFKRLITELKLDVPMPTNLEECIESFDTVRKMSDDSSFFRIFNEVNKEFDDKFSPSSLKSSSGDLKG